MKWFGNFVEPPWPVGIGWSLAIDEMRRKEGGDARG